MGIGELSPSKFKYETLKIINGFIKFSECQVPLRKFTSPIQDFLAMVLVFKHHIFSRDSLVAFDSYQSEANVQFVNLAFGWKVYACTTVWVRFTWRVLLVCVSFYSLGKRVVATWSSRCALKSLCRHTYNIGAVCSFFLNTDKKTYVIL